MKAEYVTSMHRVFSSSGNLRPSLRDEWRADNSTFRNSLPEKRQSQAPVYLSRLRVSLGLTLFLRVIFKRDKLVKLELVSLLSSAKCVHPSLEQGGHLVPDLRVLQGP